MTNRTKISIVAAVVISIIFGEYAIYGIGKEACKPKSGTVISSFTEDNVSVAGQCFATIAFDNGDTQTVNTGFEQLARGDRFTSRMMWSFVWGACQTELGWRPGIWLTLAAIPAAIFNIFLLVLPIFGIIKLRNVFNLKS